MRQNDRGLTSRETALVAGILAVLALLAVPAARWLMNAAALRTDHARIRDVYILSKTLRISAVSPVDGSDLPHEGEALTFYLLEDGSYAPAGNKYAPVPADAYVLGGTDGLRGEKCDLTSTGAITPGVPEPADLSDGALIFCGAHLKGNHVKLIYYPGPAGAWLLELGE